MKKAMKTVFNRLLAKKPENYLYAEWDKSNFKIPDELKLSETSSLGDALYVFYEAGGYDFFGVVDADQYAPNWLDFVGNLYTSMKMVCISKVTVIFTSHYRMKYAVN